MDLFQKSLIEQNITTSPHMYECIDQLLAGDAKTEILWQDNLAGTLTVANITIVMNKRTVPIYPAQANHDQQQYMQMYFSMPTKI